MEMMKFESKGFTGTKQKRWLPRRVKWKNIAGLVAMLLVIVVVIMSAVVVSNMFKPDCVEKEYLRVCFSVDKTTLPKHEVSTITTEITNMGKIPTNGTITLMLSPNLINMSSLSQGIGMMNPDDTIKREFKVASLDEVGKFKIEFDINHDGAADKSMFIKVEQKQ